MTDSARGLRIDDPPASRVEHPKGWWLALAAVAVIVASVLTNLAWWQHDRFGTFGFDTGIFAQGTWLLSKGDLPFVTVRGLNIFGDHASYILILLAPFYAAFPTVKLLLLFQVLGLVLPVFAIFAIGADKVGRPAAFAIAVAYLVYPAMNHAALWQFHPETLAAAFLAFAAWAAHRRSYWWMALALLLALLCKEDVGLVVFGFGLFLVVTGVRRIGVAVAAGGAGYFVVTTFFLVRLANGGEGTIYTARLYGIEGDGLGSTLAAAPVLVWHAMQNAVSANGTEYLALVLLPFLMLPLLGPKYLLPICGPMLLNLASTTEYQRSIEYQYLATSGPFIALAAASGLAFVAPGRARPFFVGAMAAVAVVMSVHYGPVVESWQAAQRTLPDVDRQRQVALLMIPAGEPVSVQPNTVPHVVNRREVYEFPNPFRPANWGRDDRPVSQQKKDRVKWVLVDPLALGPADRLTLADLREDPQWQTVMDGRVLLLHRR